MLGAMPKLGRQKARFNFADEEASDFLNAA